ncbi:MAG: hypothetical protein IKP20_07295 [Candidatus Methanomethylophilaceae archaeon]|nr:hypothetical protein [Candidatus Methanomethylophilaceae archaeon]
MAEPAPTPFKWKFIAFLKKIMNKDSTNFVQHVYFKIKLGEWWKLYSRVTNSREDGITYLCPYRGTGDVYLATRLLAASIGPDRVKESTVCVVGGSSVKVAKLFGFEDVKNLSQTEMDQMIILGDVAGYSALNLFVLHPDPPNSVTGISDHLRNYNGINFHDLYRAGVFGNEYMRSEPPKFDDASEKVKKFFEDNGLIPGKTIVIAPYVNTLNMLPTWFWIELVHDMKRMGYTVCTNCDKDDDVIYGTTKLFPEYSEMKDFFEYAGFLVSSRSGLCEVICSFDICKIIVYQPHQYWGEGTNISYFSLNDMGLCSDAIEFEYEGIEFLKLKDKILMLLREWEDRHPKEEEEGGNE